MKSKKFKPYVWVERAKVISALRRIFRTYPAYKTVLDRCKSEWFAPCKNGNKKRRVSFKCELCKAIVNRKDFAVDHNDPVVDTKTGFRDYNTYVSRLFCSVDNLQGLCKNCHKGKTLSEAADRRYNKKKEKKQ